MLPVEDKIPTQSDEEIIDFRRFLALVRQLWWLITLVTLIAGAAAYFVSSRMTPIYQASTKVLVNTAPNNRAADYSSVMANEQMAQTYAQMVKDFPVMAEVVKRLNLTTEPDRLAGSVQVNLIRDTQLITISVTNPNPELAAQTANEIAVVFAETVRKNETSRFAASKESLQNQINALDEVVNQTRTELNAAKTAKDTAEIERLSVRLNQSEEIYANLSLSLEQLRLTEAQTTSSITQVDPAVPSRAPISPKKSQNTLIASIVALLIVTGGIFAFDLLDDSVKNPEEITNRFKLPVLGVIADFKNTEDGLITQQQPRSPVTEAFRGLRTNVQYASVDRPLRSVMVTSSSPSEGKSTIASNLGMVLAQSGKRVTLVDADLHRPRQHKIFKTERMPGLSSIFVRSNISLNGEVQETDQDCLRLVPSGEIPPNPSELLGSNKMREILKSIMDESDVVIVDAPPVLSVTDPVALAPIVDGVLLVVRPGKTKIGELKTAIQTLRHVGANLVGVVVNGVDTKKNSYGYYYKSYYYQQYTSSTKKLTRKA